MKEYSILSVLFSLWLALCFHSNDNAQFHHVTASLIVPHASGVLKISFFGVKGS